jgi:hypothetical protein
LADKLATARQPVVAMVREQTELWRVSFKPCPNDESRVKFIVRADSGELHMDEMQVSELFERLEGWGPLSDAFYQQLRSALAIHRTEYTATVRTTRLEMRNKGLVGRYKAS